MMIRGPFSFWPQFITYFEMKSEQEAKLRQICLNEYQKLSGIVVKGHTDTPSRHIEKTNLYLCSYCMTHRLIDTLETFTKRTNDLASQLYSTVTNILDPQQLLTLLTFFCDESKYEDVVFDAIPNQLLGTLPTKVYSEDIVSDMNEAEKLIDLLRGVE